MLSIVVAAHKDPEGVYLTVWSLIQQLPMSSSAFQYEIIIAADGGTEYKWEKLGNVRCLRIKTGSPQGTRDAGIRAAGFKTVLCVEAHCVVFGIREWFTDHFGKERTITFPIRIGEGPELFNVVGSTTDWDTLWYKHHQYDAATVSAYQHPIVQFGHSCFMIDRDWYVESGGYTDLLKGWGGEEPFLCLKAWMLGKSCWMIPTAAHAHYLTPGAHKETPDLKQNLEIVKYVMSGVVSPGLKVTPEMRAERARICAGPYKGDLEALKEYFRKEGISGSGSNSSNQK